MMENDELTVQQILAGETPPYTGIEDALVICELAVSKFVNKFEGSNRWWGVLSQEDNDEMNKLLKWIMTFPEIAAVFVTGHCISVFHAPFDTQRMEQFAIFGPKYLNLLTGAPNSAMVLVGNDKWEYQLANIPEIEEFEQYGEPYSERHNKMRMHIYSFKFENPNDALLFKMRWG